MLLQLKPVLVLLDHAGGIFLAGCNAQGSSGKDQELCSGALIQDAATTIKNNTAYGAGPDVFAYDLGTIKTKAAAELDPTHSVVSRTKKGNGQRGLLSKFEDQGAPLGEEDMLLL